MSVETFKKLIQEKGNYDIIKILREGPIKTQTIVKYLERISKIKEKDTLKQLKELENHNIITSFQLKDNSRYYLLIKDFFIIRVPPKELLKHIQKNKELSKSLKEKYLSGIKRYFSQYLSSSKKLKSDVELNLIELIINPSINELIDFLNKKPIKLKSVRKKFPYFDDISDLLKKNDIIEIFSEGGISWALLNSQFTFDVFFPEYLIKNITERLRDKKIEKSLALKSLYNLKNAYLRLEKPEDFEELTQRINNKLEIIKTEEKKGDLNVEKVKELIKLYKAIGDYDNTKLWKAKVLDWLNRRQ